jgi:glucose/arabinose dehydrogenase
MKNFTSAFSLVVITILMGCSSNEKDADPISTITGTYKLVPAFLNLSFNTPVELTSPNDNTDRIFVVNQKGLIHVFHNQSDAASSSVFLDISARVASGGEKGLLGLAFHPNYKTNGYFYVNYTRGNLETVISRFKVSAADPNVADPSSELILLTYSQPYDNHNGGKVAFGNDGYLYIAAGDGGNGGDPGNRAQNKKELLGKILRIDVNNTSGNLNYAIPQDNPYKGNTDGNREEIYAYGLRNPWRFSFDKQTGTLWAGDVGQSRIEEIDIIEKGGNYGWRIMEGTECYNSTTCDQTALTAPIWSYQQGAATGKSVTGGYVCRDSNLSNLKGKYIYGDYVSGNIWALTYSGKSAVKNELIANLQGGLSSFGEDSNSNLYVLDYVSGKIFKFVAE